MDEQLLMKRTLSLYRYCLGEWARYQAELGSLLKYQADAEELLWHLLAQGNEVADFRNQLHQLNLEKMRTVDGHPMYVLKLREELDADLRSVEAYMDILHRLEYEEALHLWVSLEAAGRILTELERVDGQATHQAEWARYEALRRELAQRLEELPEDTEVVRIRPEGWSATPADLSLTDVLTAVRRWPAEKRRILRQVLEKETLHEAVPSPLPQKAVAEEGEPYTVEGANELENKG